MKLFILNILHMMLLAGWQEGLLACKSLHHFSPEVFHKLLFRKNWRKKIRGNQLTQVDLEIDCKVK